MKLLIDEEFKKLENDAVELGLIIIYGSGLRTISLKKLKRGFSSLELIEGNFFEVRAYLDGYIAGRTA